MNKKQPVFLDLTKIKLPPMAIVSIMHRLSGILLFVLLPVMMYFFGLSIDSPLSFLTLQQDLQHPFTFFVVWAFCGAFLFHVLSGLRHLVMDFGFGETRQHGHQSALGVFVVFILLFVVFTVWLMLKVGS